MMIIEQIKDHFENKKFSKIVREVDKEPLPDCNGYIVDYSKDFILLQEVDDFKVLGYIILPVNQIKRLVFTKGDKYYTKIMIWEGEINNIGVKYKIDLRSWQSIFKSIKSHQLCTIVECEAPDIDTFTIGPIVKTTAKLVYIKYFDACGFLDEKYTSVDYESITTVKFDDHYANIFSKYLRQRK